MSRPGQLGVTPPDRTVRYCVTGVPVDITRSYVGSTRRNSVRPRDLADQAVHDRFLRVPRPQPHPRTGPGSGVAADGQQFGRVYLLSSPVQAMTVSTMIEKIVTAVTL